MGKIFHLDEVEVASIYYSNSGNLIVPIVTYVLGEEKLTSSDVLYLALLYEQDGRTQDEMAEAYTVDRAATTRSLQGLEKKGLVRREVDTFDRRIRRVYLTEKAMQYRAAIRRMADDLADALFEGMSEEEVKAFMEQVEAMGQRARRLNQRQERLKAQGIDK